MCGGRDYQDAERVDAILSRLHAERTIVCIIEGGARGADTLARQWARANGIQVRTFRAQWRKSDGSLDRSAGPRRNAEMLKLGLPDAVVAFPGGDGTADMVKQARAAGLRPWEIKPR